MIKFNHAEVKKLKVYCLKLVFMHTVIWLQQRTYALLVMCAKLTHLSGPLSKYHITFELHYNGPT
jgi:hypothetical protein